MKTFLFIFLAGYAVRCDDNYYVIQMPEQPKEFKVYWNVPTIQCKSKNIPFEDMFDRFGIIQNTNDTHRGDQISILYDPGNFPALVKNESTGELKYRNGGVPQQGSLMSHLQVFKREMEKSIPDVNFSGVGIIDFESWRPIFRQNFGILTPYKDVSYDIERKLHWWWKKQWIQEEAQRRFEEAGREFMDATLVLAKKLRPKALWGYYGYPQCFNRVTNKHPDRCPKQIMDENDEIEWLWSESTALYPSVYSTKDMSPQLGAYIKGRINESARVGYKNIPILPYWWFRYRDGGYFTEADLEVSFNTFYKSNATGFIIWGSSKDVNTKSKCLQLRGYITNTLGPILAKYTKQIKKIKDEPVDISTTPFSQEAGTDLDSEYQWDPPENYTQNIENIVDEELKKENGTLENNKLNGSILIGLILQKMDSNCFGGNCVYNTEEARPGFTTETSVLTTKDPFKDDLPKIPLVTETTKNPVMMATTTVKFTSVADSVTQGHDHVANVVGVDINPDYDSSSESSPNIDTESINTIKDTLDLITIKNSIDKETTTFREISTSEITSDIPYSTEESTSHINSDVSTINLSTDDDFDLEITSTFKDEYRLSTDQSTTNLSEYSSTENTEAAVNTETPMNTETVVNTETPMNTETVVNTEFTMSTKAAVFTEVAVKTEDVTSTEAAMNTEATLNTDASVNTEISVNTTAAPVWIEQVVVSVV